LATPRSASNKNSRRHCDARQTAWFRLVSNFLEAKKQRLVASRGDFVVSQNSIGAMRFIFATWLDDVLAGAASGSQASQRFRQPGLYRARRD
jgi:hypothetical protein